MSSDCRRHAPPCVLQPARAAPAANRQCRFGWLSGACNYVKLPGAVASCGLCVQLARPSSYDEPSSSTGADA